MSKDLETIGEYRVGVSFNPSNSHKVDVIKSMAAALIDEIDSIAVNFGFAPDEVVRLKNIAMDEVESAAMWAVKAATKKDWRAP